LFLIALLFLTAFTVTIAGCTQKMKPSTVKLPAIKVELTHYYAGKDHFIKINEVKPVLVKKDEVKDIYEEPPFPGIQIFAYVFGKEERSTTPVTYIPLKREGNLTVYVGFRSPKEVPKKGSLIVVVAEVIEKVDGGFKTVATARKEILWNLSKINDK